MTRRSVRAQAGIGMTSERTRQRLIDRLQRGGISDPCVLEAIRVVPRHLFVDEALASRAYEDIALPIGFGQTMSQPYVVALMTQAVCGGRALGQVLEIGTGCGYQTAVLSQLAETVYTVERVQELFRQARDRLFDLKFRNVKYRHGDGMQGWSEHAPYDGILVAAAPPNVPEVLLAQLAVGGRMVVPVGARDLQTLTIIERSRDGFEYQELEAVNFVPLVSGTT
ncbi:MAG: protein-L-isoaspartate(D-aspartate) O-methyltransferase [Gammaproteobacteria bacterium]|nr:protein-L-isoaspartate(D-aspartate) O-methyltransferase [Gammaproteobacteria bacterium]